MIKKILTTVTIISTLIGSSFNSFAFTTSHPYVKLISGYTGKTYTWQTPLGTEITMPIIRKDAVIRLTEGQSFDSYFYDVTGKLTRDKYLSYSYEKSAFVYQSFNRNRSKNEFSPLKFTDFDSSAMNPLNNSFNAPYGWQGGDFIIEINQDVTGNYPLQGWDYEGSQFTQENANCVAFYYVTMDDNAPAVSNVGWKSDNTGWWYVDSSGNYIVNNWLLDNGKWYYFIGSGYMAKGWQKIDNKWYYFTDSGEMLANTRTADGYNLDASGAMLE